MGAPLKEILQLLASAYPPAWAVSGDHCGFEVGDPETRVDLILVALEATPTVVAEAGRKKAQLLLTHHPLLYRPFSAVRQDEPGGRLLSELIRAGLALVSCHTSLDVAPKGLNDYLANRLELDEVEVLSATAQDAMHKLTVFVPLGYEDRVRQALGTWAWGSSGSTPIAPLRPGARGPTGPWRGPNPSGEKWPVSPGSRSPAWKSWRRSRFCPPP